MIDKKLFIIFTSITTIKSFHSFIFMIHTFILCLNTILSTSIEKARHNSSITVITNYDFNSDEHYKIAASMLFNDILLPIIHKVVCVYRKIEDIYLPDYIGNYFQTLFFPNKRNIEKNLYDYTINNETVLKNICFNDYVFENFLANRSKETDNIYRIMRNSYYNFIRNEIVVLKETKAILKLYIFLNYYDVIHNYKFSFSKDKNVFNFYTVEELLKIEDQKFLFDTYLDSGELSHRIGLFVHPAFEALDTNKIATLSTMSQNIHISLGNIFCRIYDCEYNVEYVGQILKSLRPVYMDIIYKIYDDIGICRMLSVNFWLNYNFSAHLALCKHIEFKDVFEPHEYINKIFSMDDYIFNKNYTIDLIKISCNQNVADNSNLIIYTNYSINELNDDFDYSYSIVNDALFEFALIPFGTKEFILHINYKHVEHYYPLNKTPDNNEASCILKLCIIIYKEILIALEQLGFEGKENILNLYSCIDLIFEEIDIYITKFDLCVESLYEKIVNKFLIIDLYEIKFQIITNDIKTEVKKYVEDKIFDNIDYTDLETEPIETVKTRKQYVESNPNNNDNSAKIIKKDLQRTFDFEVSIFTLMIRNIIDAIFTAGIIHTTEEKYFYELVKLNLKLSVPKKYQNSHMLTPNPQYTQYNSINFMDMVYETISKRGSSLKEKKNIFYYDFFYINFKVDGEISDGDKTDIEEKMKKILKFSPEFLKKIATDYTSSIFIFNVVYIDYSNKSYTISRRLKKIYADNHVLLHNITMELTKKIINELPKLFVIKHNEIPIDNYLKTISGNRVVIIDDMQ